MHQSLSDLGHAYVFVRKDFFLSDLNYRLTRCFVGALATGRVEGLPVTLLPEDDQGLVGPFAGAKFNDPVEREGELMRRTVAPDTASRLGGVFVFADLDSCLRAADLYGWDLSTVRSGRAHGTWSGYDMQIVSVLRMPGLPESVREALWKHYWAGAPGTAFPTWEALLAESVSHREPLWEWLVDGFVQFEAADRSPFG